ncbi:MAG: rRNA pseudouridine synthase [Oscillospiraceae bacterium]|jgi:23S rRNA pseudouridine2605 synthase|nr:rRNA pseudouridine synthase [Oscillospiraceae bacterium]
MRERLQKIISSRGLMSRRAAEAVIARGEVAVDGVAAKLGDSADPETQRITVSGRPLPAPPDLVYILLNKPRGVTTTLRDDHAKKTVRGLLPEELGYLVPVGRLDRDSEGLLLMTNDGAAVRRLTHPSSGIEKEYRVTVLSGGQMTVTITEGKKHQVRNMCKAQGLTVTRLVRVREGKLLLGALKPGQWRVLSREEIGYVRGE